MKRSKATIAMLMLMIVMLAVAYVPSATADGPWFDATISPDLVAAEETLWFDITVTNNASEASIYKVDITYPANWFVDVIAPAGWLRVHIVEEHKVIFTATGGYEIPMDGSAVFRFKMTTGSGGVYDWLIECTNTAEIPVSMPVEVTVDDTPPDVTVDAPTVGYYSVGAGGYLWLNITVWDDINKLPVVALNDTRFELYAPPSVTGEYDFAFRYVNTEPIPDGPLCVQFSVTDYVGNEAAPLEVSTTVDNTPPFIWIEVWNPKRTEKLPQPVEPGPYYAGTDATAIDINVTIANYALDLDYTGVYINNTDETPDFSEVGEFMGYPVWEGWIDNYAIDLADVCWDIFVNATDMSWPSNHTSELTQLVLRDIVGPYEVGFTAAEPICGGLIIRGLYAEDLVGVYDYQIYLNGSEFTAISEEDLLSTTLTTDWRWIAFKRVAVLDLTAYAGEPVNITVKARDFGYNPSDEVTLYVGVIPEGEWYPIELYEGWNLISTPLIPAVKDIEAVLGGILYADYADLVEIIWSYDAEILGWYMHIPDVVDEVGLIEDGKGYWLRATAYDVLIIQGTELPPPPGVPPVYHVYVGWNLIGFKSTEPMCPWWEYLTTIPCELLETAVIYGWDAEDQSYYLVMVGEWVEEPFWPGEGYWLYITGEADIAPPLP